MLLRRENLHTFILRANDAEWAWLGAYLALDPATSLLGAQTFPAGLTPLVVTDAKARGFEVHMLDARRPPCAPRAGFDMAWLDDHQERGVEAVWANAAGVLHMPTASGKTEIMAALAGLFPCRWLFLVHRTALVEEIAQRIQLRIGEVVAQLGEGSWRDARLSAGTFQTFARALRAEDQRAVQVLERTQALGVDEAHILGAESYYAVAMRTPNAFYRVGFSGTPFARHDGMGARVVAALGPTIARVRVAELVSKQLVARGTVHVVALPLRNAYLAANYQSAYDLHVVRDGRRRALAVELMRREKHKLGLAFVREEAHGKLLAAALERAGMATAFVWGKRDKDYRRRAVAALESGALDNLVASVVFQEGVNVPNLARVFHFAAGKSEIATLQNTGRGARARDRSGRVVKTTFETWDIADVHCGCRTVGADGVAVYQHRACKWLDTHARARARAYVAEGYEVVHHRASEFLSL